MNQGRLKPITEEELKNQINALSEARAKEILFEAMLNLNEMSPLKAPCADWDNCPCGYTCSDCCEA